MEEIKPINKYVLLRGGSRAYIFAFVLREAKYHGLIERNDEGVITYWSETWNLSGVNHPQFTNMDIINMEVLDV